MLTASASICAAPDGILHTGPGTTVDGTTAIDGMHVLGGQVLYTAPGHLSELLTRGSSLRLLGGTKLEFSGNSAKLVAGGLLLTTSGQFSTTSACASIAPKATLASRYLVQLDGNIVYVTAQENDVRVSARKTVLVPAGKTVAVYCGSKAQNIVFLGKDLPAKVIMGSAAAATPLAGLPRSGSKQEVSSSSPFHP